MSKFFKILNYGIWTKNSSLVQLLGLCPILAVTTNVTNALGLGVVTTLVLVFTNVIISIFRFFIPKNIRIPIYMMIISAIVSCFDMLINAYSLNLYRSLGVFIPLIITNCVICGRADFIAINNSVWIAFLDALFIGLGSDLVIFLVGSIREIIGSGTLFFGIENLLGPWSHVLYIKIININYAMLFFLYPAGAFMILGFILAGKNFIDTKNSLNDCDACLTSSLLRQGKNKDIE
ncbi:electron transport complex subunit E [Buchnera aphidicola]|uniref:Ion-translocating oxidoreductase complex subunit E n=1 Tax=Buchnera aphidicola subsp. Melaphis rhois TaxID=118103 RepID=A0A4D6Y2N7_BUCMH|nr:electron transport complex subunit E [Buchnera aphidicola]QCI23149.1 electron transport complex subunit E [Buchnera aphidicola (Melaphis rhois)]